MSAPCNNNRWRSAAGWSPAIAGLLLGLAAGAALAGDETCARQSLAGGGAEAPRCTQRPADLLQLGRQLNLARRYQEAADRLEAALLLDPAAWAVEIEYAIALEGLGDYASADALLAGIAANPTVDPAIRQEIEQLHRHHRWRLGWEAPAGARNTLGLAIGYDDNLLGSTRYGSFDLTFAGSRLPVALADENARRGGRFTRLDLGRDGTLAANGEARWHYSLAASYRWSIDYEPASRAHFGLLVERSPLAAPGLYAQALAQQLHLGGPALLRLGQLGAGYEIPLPAWPTAVGACRLRLGGEVQWLAYPDNAVYNGRYAGAQGHLACPRQQWQMQWRFGEDRPEESTRPGGTQHQHTVRIGKTVALAGGQLAGEYEHYRQTDRAGYSLLLENNARRRLQRNTYRLEYRWVMAGVVPYIALEWLDQQSNLPLFAPQNRILLAGFRYAW